MLCCDKKSVKMNKNAYKNVFWWKWTHFFEDEGDRISSEPDKCCSHSFINAAVAIWMR